MKTLASIGLATAIALLATAAQATTINFTFDGSTSLDGGDLTHNGIGSFSFAPTSGPVSLADLTAFNMTFCTDGCAQFAVGLGDLASFSLSSGDSPTAAISFQTNFVPNIPSVNFFDEEFGATGTLAGATGLIQTVFGNIDQGPVVFSIVASAVPEPLTLSLFGAGLVGAAAMRRRQARKP